MHSFLAIAYSKSKLAIAGDMLSENWSAAITDVTGKLVESLCDGLLGLKIWVLILNRRQFDTSRRVYLETNFELLLKTPL